MVKCSKCDKIVNAEDLLKCMNCPLSFHYECAGKTEDNFKKMGRAKTQWRCSMCKDGSGKGETDEVGKKEKERDDRLMTAMRKMFQDFTTGINTKLSDFENTLQFNSGKMDDVVTGFNEMKKNFIVIQKKQEELANENLQLKKKVKELAFQMNKMEQRSLDHNIEILGVPDAIEDPQVIVRSLCEKIKVQTPGGDTYVVKRATVGVSGKPKPVTVEFNSKALRDKIVKECKKAKPKVSDFTKAPLDTQDVFVNEQLSPFMKQLLFNATKIKKEKRFAFLWVSDGRILLRKTQDSRVTQVHCIEDIQRE
uniref:PHD-type domain-containing protein n=1 Tax=Cacopsylla melanoneura TaxID=428564 RepID=A0A8D8Z3Z7_9HEMI